MPQQQPRTRLEQRVQAEHLSLREFVAQFQRVATETAENIHVSERQAKRWLAGEADLPRPAACRVLERWFGQRVSVLLGPPDAGPPAATLTEEELIMTAGRESGRHALSAATALDDAALEHLHADTHRLARAYFTSPPLTLFAELVTLRSQVADRLDQTRRPRQEAELYLILGQLCGLLSSVSWALGHLEAAEEHARAAYTYGRIIEHPSLSSWARALQVTAVFWSGRPRQAAALAAAAIGVAPPGTHQEPPVFGSAPSTPDRCRWSVRVTKYGPLCTRHGMN